MDILRALCDLKVGESGVVAEVSAAETAMERRLRDLGLIPGTVVVCTARGPAGDPCAYRIRGAVIAIRRRDALGVALHPAEAAAPCPVEHTKVPAF